MVVREGRCTRDTSLMGAHGYSWCVVRMNAYTKSSDVAIPSLLIVGVVIRVKPSHGSRTVGNRCRICS